MPKIFFDIESRSAVSLEDAGVSRYASDPSTDILCVTYVIDDGEPQIWLPGQPIPEDIIAVTKQNPDWIAHNIMFDRTLMTHVVQVRYGWPEIPLERQICTMSLALANALPGALDKAAAALGLPLRKDPVGYRLMRKMSRPLPRRKNDPADLIRWYEPKPEERELFHDYAKRDPVLSRLLYQTLLPLPPSEQAQFVHDAVVNERGFHVDVALAQAARNIAHSERLAINAEIAAHTEGEITSAHQRDRIVTFVRRHGHAITSLTKRSVSAILAHEPCDAVRRLLELRREGARASVQKLDRLLASVDNDHRLRATLRYLATSTGRWSGRGYQPQNLKKIETTDVDAAVEAILSSDMDRIRELGAPLTVAADISRAIICAAPGHVLMGGDFSAIESRKLAWIAGEDWKLETYRKYDETGDPQHEPYCVMASQALKRTVTPDDEAGRNFGKTYDLAFGFGGGLGAWRKFDNSDTYSDAEIEQFRTATAIQRRNSSGTNSSGWRTLVFSPAGAPSSAGFRSRCGTGRCS
jgi:DNA polymerase